MSSKKGNTYKDQKPPNLSEPESAYTKPTIRFFSSFEEQREEMYVHWASLSPIELMTNLHDLIIRSFDLSPEKLANPQLDHKIKFRKQ